MKNEIFKKIRNENILLIIFFGVMPIILLFFISSIFSKIFRAKESEYIRNLPFEMTEDDSFNKSFEDFEYVKDVFINDDKIDFITMEKNLEICAMYYEPRFSRNRENLIPSPSDKIEIYAEFLKKHHTIIGEITRKDNAIRFESAGFEFGKWRYFDTGYVYSPDVDLSALSEENLRSLGYLGVNKTKHPHWYSYGLAGTLF